MLKSIIVAKTENNVIGRNNQLPWHLPEDMKHFKHTTLGHHLIMGRKTFASLKKPLPDRKIIIVTRKPNYQAAGCHIAHHLKEAFSIAEKAGEKEVFIAGGGTIYREVLALADKIYLTEIKTSLAGDTFFPVLATKQWIEVKRTSHKPDAKHRYPYDFVELKKVI